MKRVPLSGQINCAVLQDVWRIAHVPRPSFMPLQGRYSLLRRSESYLALQEMRRESRASNPSHLIYWCISARHLSISSSKYAAVTLITLASCDCLVNASSSMGRAPFYRCAIFPPLLITWTLCPSKDSYRWTDNASIWKVNSLGIFFQLAYSAEQLVDHQDIGPHHLHALLYRWEPICCSSIVR